MRPLQSIPMLCAAIAIAWGAPAAATIYCVNSVATLNAAFTSANAAAEGTVQDIRVRPGTYNVPGGLQFYPAGDKDGKYFSLSGGWSSDCSTRSINPAASILNAENGAVDGDFNFVGDQALYVVEGLSLRNFGIFYLNDPACGFNCPDTEAIRIRYNEFRNGGNVLIETEDAATLAVSNNLFADLHPGANFAALSIIYANNETAPVIAFNTVANAVCANANHSALYFFAEIINPVLHHNIVNSSICNYDIEVPSNVQPILRSNLYETLGTVPSTSSGNVVTGTPGFVNAAAGDYHLRETAPLSPAINAGLTAAAAASYNLSASIPGQDLDGPAGGRLVGVHYDLGAYESSINDSSTLTVINSNDSGAGSLRAAITAANAAPGAQLIDFNIAGACPRLISLDTPLPDVVDDLEIDGYSQPGASPNTAELGTDAELCVVILASSGTLAQALQVPQAAPAGTNLTLRGIAFAGSTGFNGNFTAALRLRGGQNHVIQGNAFGGVGPGSVGSLGTLNFGVQIRGTAYAALIGGANPEHRNSFGAMNSSAIVINDNTSVGHIVQNNYIGLSADGIQASAIGLNGIFSSDVAYVQILDNVIASVGSNAAISISGFNASNYTIARNKIGVNAYGIPTPALRNGTGILFASDTHYHIVGNISAQTSSNLITNSDGAGVWISPTAGDGILVRPNRIFDNGKGGVGLGIDIGTLGQSNNDLLDPDTGPNNGQNWPVITASLPNADGSRAVTFTLNTTPNTLLRVDIYRSPSCPAGNRGADLLNRIADVTGTSNAAGDYTATFNLSGSGAPGVLSAIATNLTTRDTSEPGTCFAEPAATTTTITNDDPDPSQIGQPYTVTVLVSSLIGEPSGSVTIGDGLGNQCTDNTLSGGIGSCQLLSTSVGNKTLTANYLGSISHAPSSDTAPHSVVAASTTTTIVSDLPDPSEVGQAYTVSVQVRTAPGNLATPGGQVAVSDGTGQTCQIVALSGGNGSCQLTSVSVGNKILTASYAGAINFVASSDTEAHTVVAATTITTITSDAPDPSLPGQSYTVTATVTSLAGTPTGTVAVTDGAGANCMITLAGGGGSCQLASAAVGNKTLTATYTPNSQAYAASNDTEAHAVNSAQAAATTTLITADTPEPTVPGQPYTVSVTISSQAGTPTGTVNVDDGVGAGSANCQINLVNGSGSCQLISNFAGGRQLTACMQANASFAGSCDTEEHQTAKADTDLAFNGFAPDPASVGQPTQVTVALSVAAPGAGTPTGTLTVSASATEQCTVTPPAASCALILTSAGNRTISVDYPGDSNYNASTRQTTLTVLPDQLLSNGFE